MEVRKFILENENTMKLNKSMINKIELLEEQIIQAKLEFKKELIKELISNNKLIGKHTKVKIMDNGGNLLGTLTYLKTKGVYLVCKNEYNNKTYNITIESDLILEN